MITPYGSLELGRRHPWWHRLWWRVSPRCTSAHFPAGPPTFHGKGCSRKRDHRGSHVFDLPVTTSNFHQQPWRRS